MAKRKPGRPTRLSARVRRKFLHAVALGVSFENCARVAGIAPRTYFKWAERAQKGGPSNVLYVQFMHEVEAAIAESEQRLAQVLEDATKLLDHPATAAHAAKWKLERRFHDQWGPKNKHEISGPDGAPVIGVVILPAEDK